MKIVPIAFVSAGMIATTTPAIAEQSKTYDLPEFDRIDVSAGVTLIANVGNAQTVVVETDNGDFSDFHIDVDGSRLKVSRKWSRLAWHGSKADYKVKITVQHLNSLEASSGSHAKIMNIDAPKFLMNLSSGAHAYLEGASEECALDLSSGANLDAKELTCDRANIDVSSGGHGEMYVTHAVVADASSGGHVSIYGNPERIKVDKSSGGRIKIKTGAQASRD